MNNGLGSFFFVIFLCSAFTATGYLIGWQDCERAHNRNVAACKCPRDKCPEHCVKDCKCKDCAKDCAKDCCKMGEGKK